MLTWEEYVFQLEIVGALCAVSFVAPVGVAFTILRCWYRRDQERR